MGDIEDLNVRTRLQVIAGYALGKCEGKLGLFNAARGRLEALKTPCEDAFGADSIEMFRVRYQCARWCGHIGEYSTAVSEFRALIDLRGNGTTEWLRLQATSQLAKWTGMQGAHFAALALLHGLPEDLDRVVGANSEASLSARRKLCYWTGRNGALEEAVHEYERLLELAMRSLPDDHQLVFEIAADLAYWTDALGRPEVAQGRLRELLTKLRGQRREISLPGTTCLFLRGKCDCSLGNISRGVAWMYEAIDLETQRVGEESPEALKWRKIAADWKGHQGRPGVAVNELGFVIESFLRHIEADSPRVLVARALRARWTAVIGDLEAAAGELEDVIKARTARGGPDSFAVSVAKMELAGIYGQQGRLDVAISEFEQLALRLAADFPGSTEGQWAANGYFFWLSQGQDGVDRAIIGLKDLHARSVKLSVPQPRLTVVVEWNLARAMARTGDWLGALEIMSRLQTRAEDTLGYESAARFEFASDLAWVAHKARIDSTEASVTRLRRVADATLTQLEAEHQLWIQAERRLHLASFDYIEADTDARWESVLAQVGEARASRVGLLGLPH